MVSDERSLRDERVIRENRFFGPLDPAAEAGYGVDAPPRMGFFTDTSVCIGCKACEVACKEWNNVPETGLDLLGMSYDNTGDLTANSWRHVAFVEQPVSREKLAERGTVGGGQAGKQPPAFEGLPTTTAAAPESAARAATTGKETGTRPGVPVSPEPGAAAEMAGEFLGMPSSVLPGQLPGGERTDFRWLMMSDVCKHCTHAGCLDVCPTGALFRTEFGTVVVQEDICNGCGYCISGCPYGVIDQRKDDGRAWKCTLCYDRLRDGMMPACAKACPTESIQYGPLDELRERAAQRLDHLHDIGETSARLYGNDPKDGVGGDGAFFLLLDEPEVYGLPPDPVVPTRDLPGMYRRAAVAAVTMAAAVAAVFIGRRS
jgi:formate dehydrogenase iron-sulfur subunit